MATLRRAEGTGEVRKMGLGGLVTRFALAGAIAWGGLTGGGWVMEKINPKPLSVVEMKDAAGNIEFYLKYKSGEGYALLQCDDGPKGPLCGTVEYWWQSVGTAQREELVVGEWAAISNDAKYGVMSKELQKILDAFYGVNGVQKASQQQPQQQYGQQSQK
ncbi:hypothetical protein HYV85_02590 [Candidatus Woesearchaeota archaeon]|nr:hypothetical protein [Candidatus Woesearchaeota archaeon]